MVLFSFLLQSVLFSISRSKKNNIKCIDTIEYSDSLESGRLPRGTFTIFGGKLPGLQNYEFSFYYILCVGLEEMILNIKRINTNCLLWLSPRVKTHILRDMNFTNLIESFLV